MTRRTRRRVHRACLWARMLTIPALLFGAVALWVALS